MVLTTADLNKLTRIYQSLGGSRRSPTAFFMPLPGDEEKRERREPMDEISLFALTIQLRGALSRINAITSRLAELDSEHRQLYETVNTLTTTTNSILGTVTGLRYNLNLFQQGGINRGFALLGALTTGVSRGLEAAEIEMEARRVVEEERRWFGTEADLKGYLLEQRIRQAFAIFGIRT